VKVTHEIALQPGMATYERYFDPKEGEVRVQNGEASDYPTFPVFEPLTLLLKRYKVVDNRMVIQEAEALG